MANRYITNQRANIAATRRILAQSRNKGYKAVTDIISGIEGNLRTTSRANNALLIQGQAQTLAALKRLQGRTNAKGTRLASRARTQVANLYGSAVAGGTDFSAVDARVRSNEVAQRGLTGSARLLAQGNAAAAATQEQGVTAAAEAAKYAASQAKLYRAKDDARLIAEQQVSLQQMRLQAKLDLENYKKKLALEDQKTNSTAASALGNLSASALPDLVGIFRESHNAESSRFADLPGFVAGDSTLTPAQAAAVWAAEHGYGADSPQYQVVLAMANAMARQGVGVPEAQGWDRAAVANAAADAITQLYPDLSPKVRDSLAGMMTSSMLDADLSMSYIGGQAPEPSTGSRNVSSYGMGQPVGEMEPVGSGWYRDQLGYFWRKNAQGGWTLAGS